MAQRKDRIFFDFNPKASTGIVRDNLKEIKSLPGVFGISAHLSKPRNQRHGEYEVQCDEGHIVDTAKKIAGFYKGTTKNVSIVPANFPAP